MPAFPYSHTLPFFLYLLFLGVAQGLASLQEVGQAWVVHWDLRWLYTIKVTLVAALLWHFRHCYTELKSLTALNWQHGLLALVTGTAVFLLWINLDISWLSFSGDTAGYDPRSASGAINWALVLPRLLGAVVVVPLMEEIFWRSFVMRWIDHQDFMAKKPAQISLRALLISAVLFGFGHQLWFAGIIAGLAYGWLYLRSANLWVPVLAHAVTNGLLGVWVLQTGHWHFW